MRRLTALVSALSLVLSSAPALAQPSGDAKSAIEQFRAAQKAFDNSEFDQALEAAKTAYAQTKSPNAHLYVARSLRGLGRLDEAYREMKATLDEATELAQSEKKYVPTRDAAAAELALLDKKVGKLVVALANPPPGARVELDGKRLPNEELGVPLPVMPGKIRIKASAPGMKDDERELSVAAGATETVAIALAEAGSPKPPPPPKPAPKKSSGSPWRTVGFVSAGVGVAGLAVFAVAGSMAKSKFNQLEDECGGTRCSDPKYADTVDSGKRSQTIANVGLVVGAVGIVAGGALIAFGGSSSSEKAAKGPTMDVGSRGVTLGYAGVF